MRANDITQLNLHEHDFSIHCTIRECRYISNTEHVLSRVFSVIDDRHQQHKEKEANNMIKLNLCVV